MLSFTSLNVCGTPPSEITHRLLVAIVSVGAFTQNSIPKSSAPQNQNSKMFLDCNDSSLLLAIVCLYTGSRFKDIKMCVRPS